MNKSYRIKTELGTNVNKHIKLKLDNNVSSFDILSLNISQRNSYQAFNGDFGVVVGRVIANGGVGIPNAKVSIFIPLDEQDEQNDNIRAIYPYKTPRDKNIDGKRYNLLPRVARRQPDGTFKPRQPFGSFPTKEEFLVNDDLMYVYKKYYKYTTVTNKSGDYMLYGVPVGVQTVHMSVDITDIGQFSMTPQTMVTALGYSPNLFNNNGNTIKPSNDLDDLPNIDTQEISVDVIPFYGDEENFNIGITRQDFRIRAELATSVTIFGSAMTMGSKAVWGDPSFDNQGIKERFARINPGGQIDDKISINEFREGNINTNILYVPNTKTDAEVDDGSYYNSPNDLLLLSPDEYFEFKRNGSFVYIIPCNRKKIITNEVGNLIEVSADNPDGIFTEFVGCFLTQFEDLRTEIQSVYDSDNDYYFDTGFFGGGGVRPTVFRPKIKIPQSVDAFESDVESIATKNWIKKVKRFRGNEFYSIAQFHFISSSQEGNSKYNELRDDPNNNVGLIVAENSDDFFYFFKQTNGETFGRFGLQWLNMNLTYVQNIYAIRGEGEEEESAYESIINEQRTDNFLTDNDDELGGGLRNSALLLRGDINLTDFINIPLADLIKLNSTNDKAVKSDDLNLEGGITQSTFPSGNQRIPVSVSNTIVQFNIDDTNYKTNLIPPVQLNDGKTYDGEAYFYKGKGGADCIRLLFDLEIL